MSGGRAVSDLHAAWPPSARPIRHCGHAEDPDPLPIRLWYFHHPDRLWKVTPRGHPIPKFVEVAFQISLKLLDRCPVDPRSSVVGLDPLVRFPDHILGDRKRLRFEDPTVTVGPGALGSGGPCRRARPPVRTRPSVLNRDAHLLLLAERCDVSLTTLQEAAQELAHSADAES